MGGCGFACILVSLYCSSYTCPCTNMKSILLINVDICMTLFVVVAAAVCGLYFMLAIMAIGVWERFGLGGGQRG